MNLNKEQLEAEFGVPMRIEMTVGTAMALAAGAAALRQRILASEVEDHNDVLSHAENYLTVLAAGIRTKCPESARLIKEALAADWQQ